MIKKLLFSVALMLTILSGNAQIISVAVVGEASGGWPAGTVGEVDTNQMTSIDGENWTISGLVLTNAAPPPNGGIKFRANNGWAINWGGTFPSGVGVLDGPNIRPIEGTYDVTFNSTTGVYAFTGGPVIPIVKLVGDAVTPAEGLLLTTSNGIDYTLSNVTLADGSAHFNVDGQIYAGDTFPAGVATTAIVSIPVTAGTYTVNINIVTGVYNFAYPSIGILGTVLGPDGFSGEDVDLTTVDGINYQLQYTLLDGLLKFRQDNSWNNNWGGTDLSGTAVVNGDNINVSAGDYVISFNRNTLAYSISESLGIQSSSIKTFAVHPNPTQQTWNFSSDNTLIKDLSVYDLTGKLVLSLSPKSTVASVNASILSNGIYFAKIFSENAVQTIKIIKE